jgi:hypothetical protein
MRIARAFPQSEIRVLAEDEGGSPAAGNVRFVDAAQFAIRASGERRWRSSIELFHRDRPSSGKQWFAFTEKKLFILDQELKIMKPIRLKEITGVSVRGSIISIRAKKGDPVEFLVPDETEAWQIRDWVVTRAQLLVAGDK